MGDVWVAVGWSSDVLPVVKRMSNVAVIVPKSGASLWADLWVYLSNHFIFLFLAGNMLLYIKVKFVTSEWYYVLYIKSFDFCQVIKWN